MLLNLRSIYTMYTLTYGRELCLGCETQLRSVAVKDNELALQENVTKNAESNTRVALNTTEACLTASIDRREVDERARHGSTITANVESDIWKSATARESISTLGRIISRAWNSAIVGGHNWVVNEKQGGTSVSNRRDSDGRW